ncbi:protein of unknown function [Taphrina deformans PYCC 5710]|uniref:Cytochrome b2, mitochondrial n=1 Tax=Taphrina deformans (strain PYCC 5710 / ATCC 11124 / CBS 356.35 / IMI 108563 / JCM 9778 / NBRC 8474) TaxID=1097556 RepID=R4XN94_TAPDE|nr:protein of unknown function [Taphrina deformans PYCC 5710]|eukprot:CCG84714.1 protein of unknown function [Taphrina deformans PYCC 5710]
MQILSTLLWRTSRKGLSGTVVRCRKQSTYKYYSSNVSRLGVAWSASAAAFGVGVSALCLYHMQEERQPLRAEHDHSLRTRKLIDGAEIKKHNTADSCWVVVNGAVWDMTDFLAAHPGGMDAVLRVAGTDASKVFNPIHPSDTLKEGLQPQNCLGELDPNGEQVEISTPEVKPATVDPDQILPLASIVDLDDFETMAKLGLSEKAWSYYASTADDGKTYNSNRASWSGVILRPRILVDVSNVDYSGQILGNKVDIPIYISPAALAKLAHEEGEVALCQGAYKSGIVQCISSNASCSLTEIHDAATAEQVLFFQLYVNRDSDKADALLKKLKTLPKIRAVYLTVDAPVGGKRVLDEKYKAAQSQLSGSSDSTSTVMFSGVSPALTWSYLDKLKSELPDGMPIMIKGVSTVEDAIMAYKAGATGIVLSNHGGRQLDTSPSPLLTLLEIRKHAPWLIKDNKGNGFEIHIDGGIRRGTDVLKALALGATACGLGRPFLYSLANEYGVDGVVKVVDILKNEMAIGMRLLGVTNLDDLRRHGHKFVNTKAMDPLVADADLSQWPELGQFK